MNRKGDFKMTSTQFIKDVAAANKAEKKWSQKDVREFLDAVEAMIKTKVANGETFKVCDVTYSVKDTAPRTGHNPRTGETIDIPASKRVAFKAASDLKLCAKGA